MIQLFTRKGEGPPAPYVSVGVGNRGTRKLEAGVSGATGVDNAFDYAFSLAHERSDGWDIRAGVPHNPDSDDYRSTSGHARLGFKIDARHRLDATLLANQLNSGYDAYLSGMPKPSTPLDDDRNKERLRTAGLTWTADWSDAYTMRLSATDSYSRYETTPSPYLTETRLRNYLWQNDYRLGVHRFSAALERREDELTNPALDAWSTAIRGSRAQNALALGYGLHAGAHTLQLHWRHDDDSEFGIKNTASAAYGYAFAPHWRATASWGSAFRAPTLYQRFSEYGNPALQPETSYNAELGLRYDQGRSSASLVVYRNRVSNLINFVGAGTCASAYGCYANTAHARYQGVTLAGSQRWGGCSCTARSTGKTRATSTPTSAWHAARSATPRWAQTRSWPAGRWAARCRPRASASTTPPTKTGSAATRYGTCTRAPRWRATRNCSRAWTTSATSATSSRTLTCRRGACCTWGSNGRRSDAGPGAPPRARCSHR